MKNHWFWGQTKNFAGNTLGFVENLQNKGLKTYTCNIAFRKFHFLLDPDPIVEVLQKKDKHFRKSFAYKGVSDFLGNGLLTNEGQDWLEKRRILQPKFSKKSIESLHQQVENTTEVFLLKHKDTKLDLQAFFTELITEIISAILFSEDKAEMKGRDLMDLLLTLRMHANDKLKNPLKLPLWFPNKANTGFKEAHYTIRTYVKGKVEARVNSNESK